MALSNGEWKETGVGSDRDGTFSLEFSLEGLQQAEEGPWVSDAGTPWPWEMGGMWDQTRAAPRQLPEKYLAQC